MSSVTLPYYRERHLLPADLPTKREIEESEDLPCIRDRRYGRVVVIGQLFVVKYGTGISENEGHALLFVEEHLRIPAPRLYAMYRDGRTLYLVMEYLSGKCLKHIWTELEESDKLSIASELHTLCNQMRALPSPGYIGNLSKGPVPHHFFWTMTPDRLINGPFESSAEVGLALAMHSQQNWATNNRRGFVSEWFARHLQTALGSHKSVFTHADLHPQNIIVREKVSGSGENQKRCYIVSGVVDWESAGWYPDYWEYAGSFVDFDWRDDWPEKYELIIQAQPLQAALLKFVRQDLDF
jgi:serine/threonine protein kinase